VRLGRSARVMNDALQNVGQWMRANKLSINTDKTNYVIFKSWQKKITSDISLAFEGILLARKQQVKFLGIYLDENLSWKSHINHVCKNISKSIGIIFRARLHLSSETKLLLYLIIIRRRRSDYWRIFTETKSGWIFTVITEPEPNNCFSINF
jgi:hypothetical protein